MKKKAQPYQEKVYDNNLDDDYESYGEEYEVVDDEEILNYCFMA